MFLRLLPVPVGRGILTLMRMLDPARASHQALQC
jgi:hypothetical protein